MLFRKWDLALLLHIDTTMGVSIHTLLQPLKRFLLKLEKSYISTVIQNSVQKDIWKGSHEGAITQARDCQATLRMGFSRLGHAKKSSRKAQTFLKEHSWTDQSGQKRSTQHRSSCLPLKGCFQARPVLGTGCLGAPLFSPVIFALALKHSRDNHLIMAIVI